MRSLVVRLIRLYQRYLSPLKPPMCRYRPTCSAYCAEAVQVHGTAYGLWLGFWRIMRCHPLFPGGYDPVPPPGIQLPGDRAMNWYDAGRAALRLVHALIDRARAALAGLWARSRAN